MTLPLKRYADFSGRSRRKEYWMFILLTAILYGIVGALFFGVARGSDPGAAPSAGFVIALVLAAVVGLGLAIPSIAVQVRRFHDQDKSGWFFLINFVPYVGGLIVLVFMCLPGTRGPNRFGPDPIDDHLTEVFR